MNKKLDESLVKVVEKSLELAEKTGEFVIEQSPLVLQEFYNWHLYRNIFDLSVCFIICFTSFVVFRKVLKKEKENNYDLDSLFSILSGILSLILCVFSFFCLIYSLSDLLFLITAPKLYLIEHFLK